MFRQIERALYGRTKYISPHMEMLICHLSLFNWIFTNHRIKHIRLTVVVAPTMAFQMDSLFRISLIVCAQDSFHFALSSTHIYRHPNGNLSFCMWKLYQQNKSNAVICDWNEMNGVKISRNAFGIFVFLGQGFGKTTADENKIYSRLAHNPNHDAHSILFFIRIVVEYLHSAQEQYSFTNGRYLLSNKSERERKKNQKWTKKKKTCCETMFKTIRPKCFSIQINSCISFFDQ